MGKAKRDEIDDLVDALRSRFKTKKRRRTPQRTRPRCKVCGMRVRGKRHAEGSHHRAAVERQRKTGVA